MLEHTYDCPSEREWLLRGDKWLSHTIQNEVIAIFADAVQREIVARARECPFYGLTGGGTTDIIGNMEQFSVSLHSSMLTITCPKPPPAC